MKAFIWVYSIHKVTFQILSPFFCWLFFSFEVSFLISEQKFIADLCTNSLLKSFEIFSPYYPFSTLVYHKNILRFLSNRLFFHSFKTSNWTKLLGSERTEPVFRKRQKVSNKHAGSDSAENQHTSPRHKRFYPFPLQGSYHWHPRKTSHNHHVLNHLNYWLECPVTSTSLQEN